MKYMMDMQGGKTQTKEGCSFPLAPLAGLGTIFQKNMDDLLGHPQ